MTIPAGLEAQRSLGEEWADWLDRLPRLRAELLEEWGLAPDGEPMHGFCSLVLPVVDADGVAAALKLALPDDESEHEALALQHWQGDGTVRLLRADPHRRAMLLERLHPRDLSDLWDVAACEVVAGFYPRLHRPAPPQLRPLTSYVSRWLDDLEGLGRELPVPPRMVEQALHLGRALVSDAASTGVMIHGDLHYANVLAADREPWLVIDPKPMSGDPHYEPAPLLHNRWEEVQGDVRASLRRRFHTVVDAAGLDEARARDWTVVRMVVDASWAVQDARRAGRALDADERDHVTRCVAIVKAVQE
ncbi:aminoglycoside phosphotransferase family protein [Nocardioides euryhalodurans]|uniref:Aminoglycoside resistance protein n=1 Tax=Nocardioides euryhalodurans TaxID=2518370 RepID=A0A4P7GI80_9ACTN|nr:aminoglycoside phosphotransferase family protein [Nocardioides euryhalodurans]QBR91650.1 aminoglycoside resistance protein [Nocardioides euryhalodurans]